MMSESASSGKTARDINDFQPDAISLRNAPLPWWAGWGVIWLFCFAMAVLAWASLCKLDIIVQAPGKIISKSPTIEMRPLEHAAIREIKVRVGDRVAKGQVLITFDPVFNAADEARLASDLKRYSAHVGRLEAELEKKDYAAQQDDAAQRWEHSLFETRKKLYDQRITSFSEGIARLEQYAADKEQQLMRYRELEHNYMSRRAVIPLRELHELGVSRIQVEADIKSLDRERLAMEAERNAFIEEWNSKVLEELVAVRQELVKTEKEYEKIRQLVSYVSLCAPEDAVVHMIAPVAPGSAVREAEPLITLVPLHEGMEAEVEVSAMYIGRVKAGQSARLKLNAFPFQQYGTLDGTVVYISRDTLNSERKDVPPWYMARISITKGQADEKRIFLLPGMEIQAEILVGKRRIIEYALYPLIKVFDEALREP